MIGMLSLRASATARCSLLVSTTQIGRRHLLHVADTAEAALELVLLAGQHQDFLLGATLEATGLLHGLELLEALQALVHGGEVGEHAAQPALVHVGHADAGRLLGDGLLRLLLGADEHDAAAVGDGLLDELVRLVDVGQRLLQIDDVDAVAVGEDEPLHLGIPATGLMPEVGAAVQQLLHGYNSHGRPCPSVVGCRPASGDAGPWRLLVAGPVRSFGAGPPASGYDLGRTGLWRRRAKSARASELRIAVYTLLTGAFSTADRLIHRWALAAGSHRRRRR